MAYLLSKGYTDSLTGKSTTIPDLDYSDFAVVSESPSEVILSNLTSPIDRTETIRYAIQGINDVYNNTDIDSSVKAASHKGISLVCQVNDIYSYTDETDPSSARIDLPVSAHLVIKVPKSTYITADDYLAVAQRAFSAIFGTGSATSAQLQLLLRGAINPKEI